MARFDTADPCFTGGVVTRWHVRAWDVAIGTLA